MKKGGITHPIINCHVLLRKAVPWHVPVWHCSSLTHALASQGRAVWLLASLPAHAGTHVPVWHCSSLTHALASQGRAMNSPGFDSLEGTNEQLYSNVAAD